MYTNPTLLMRRLFILLITASSFTAQGQGNKPAKHFKQIQVGINFSPDYDFRTLKNNDGSSSSGLVIKSRNDVEAVKFGYTTGFNICINFSQLAALETGIQYSNKGYKTKKQALFYAPPNPGLPVNSKSIYSYQYIGIPLKVKVGFGNGKVRFLSSVGLMANFLLNVKQTSIYEYSDNRTEKKKQSTTAGYKKVDISPTISVGIDYKISSRIHLTAEPTFRYGIIKTTDTPVTENLWNAGLNIGAYYSLK
ncbi:MAG: PorT family protein [Chitinophagaceae bacterium]|nr:PorT family protein [Chitinophagaceae bacterium]